MFDWQNDTFTADYSLFSPTLSTGLSNFDLGGGSSATYVDQTDYPQPTPTGGTFDGILKGITATADTFLSGVGKIYALDNAISSAKLQQLQTESNLRVQELTTKGGLDLKTAQLQAQKEIGVAQAQAAVKNEQARIASSQGASFVSMPQSLPMPLILIGGLVALYFATRGAK